MLFEQLSLPVLSLFGCIVAFGRRDGDQVTDLGDHAANGRRISMYDRAAILAQPKSGNYSLLSVLFPTNPFVNVIFNMVLSSLTLMMIRQASV